MTIPSNSTAQANAEIMADRDCGALIFAVLSTEIQAACC
jgi:hypothetical protein